MIYQPKALEFLAESVGAERILMRTDHSGDMSAWRDVPALGKLDFLSDRQKQQILDDNAARLFDLT